MFNDVSMFIDRMDGSADTLHHLEITTSLDNDLIKGIVKFNNLRYLQLIDDIGSAPLGETLYFEPLVRLSKLVVFKLQGHKNVSNNDQSGGN